MAKWTINDIPSQSGRVAIVTGTGGLGYETALALATAGSDVILAGRNSTKGEAAVAGIRAAQSRAKVRFRMLDLASLASVASFAEGMRKEVEALDLLVNNAGVMAPPTRQTTADGFELQLGTNYLGHFALTAHLLPLLRRGRQPRLVNISSGVNHFGTIDFADLQSERYYGAWKAYAQSKLAMLMFSLEFDKRSTAQGWEVMGTAAHPGYAHTNLIANGPGNNALGSRLSRYLLTPWASQSAAAGALPTLFAATAPQARGGGYYGPSWIVEMIGPPTTARITRRAQKKDAAARLWDVAVQLTGANYGT